MKNSFGIKKNDIILFALVTIIALTVFLFYSVTGKSDEGIVIIKVDGEIQGRYSLIENQTIEINDGTNILIIKDGEADMVEAECPDKLCVNQKPVSKNHENIICLPNKVVVEVESNENSDYDAVTN